MDSDLPAPAKHIAHCLRTFMYDGKNHCYPSIRGIAAKTSLGTTTIQQHIKTLIKRGWVVKTTRSHRVKTNSGAQMCNEYHIRIPSYPQETQVCREPIHHKKVCREPTQGVSAGDERCVGSRHRINNRNNNRNNNSGKVCREPIHVDKSSPTPLGDILKQLAKKTEE